MNFKNVINLKHKNYSEKGKTFQSILQRKIFKNFLIIVLIFIILLYFLIYDYVQKRIYNRFEISINILAKSIVNPLYNLDFKTLKNILEAGLLNQEIYEIIVIDEFNNKIDIKKNKNNKIKFKEYEIDILKDNFKIGKIIVYYDIKTIINKLFYTSFLLLLLITISAILFYHNFNKFILFYLITPFNKLLNTIDSIIKKNYNSRIDYQNFSLIETKKIAQKFNLMADEIEKTISKLNEKQIQLNYSLKNFKLLVNSIPDAIFIYNTDYKMIYANERACELYGYTKEEIVNKSILERSSSDFNLNDIIEKFNFVKENKKELQFEWVAKKKTGETFPIIVRINYIKYNGEDALLSVVTDKTELYKIKQTLTEIESRYRNLFNNLPVGVFYFDKSGKIILYNPGLENIFSFLTDKTNVMEILYKDRIKKKIEMIINGKNDIVDVELKYNENMVDRYLGFKISSLKDKDGNVIGGIGIVNDITSEKKLEKEYLKASKLESLGILAGGIAHDFNNIFAGIIGNITLAKYLIPEDPELKEVLQDIEDISLKAKTLTNQILTFSKGSTPVKKVFDVSELLKKMISLLFAGEKIKIIKHFQKVLLSIYADPDQTYNALYNILCNAKEAVNPQNGEIKIEVTNFIKNNSNNEKIDLNKREKYKYKDYEKDLDKGKYIKIIIEDNGEGIEKEYIHKIFDPYFTTKKSGKGIGLAVSYSIIRKHKGYIFCESEINKGTKFIIYLPAFDIFSEELYSDQSNQYKKENIIEKEYKLKGNVLVMDDEIVIRKTLEKMFDIFGVKTYTVEEGKKAVNLYKKLKKEKKKIDLVILDLTVPGGFGGKEVIKELKEFDPEVKAIISSGYSNDDIMGNYKNYGFIDVIRKPYTLDELYNVCKRYLK